MFDRFSNRTQRTTLAHWLDTTPSASNDLPCTVRSLDVQAHVCGIHAEVTQTIEIENPNARPISASLTIPLPDRAVVCGYALEIGNQMVDGVVVPKERSRVIFETEQRRGVDPGLVEVVRGNVYRARVYPIPQNATRSVSLRYVAPLLLAPDGSATLDLPMPPDRLAHRSIRLDVEQLDAPRPRISGVGANQLVSSTGWSFKTQERDLVPTEAVRIALPDLPRSFALLERDEKGDVWFCASEATTSASPFDVQPITSLTVLWDASGSRATQDHSAELALLNAYASSVHIRRLSLVVFAAEVRETCEFSSAENLVRHISGLRYDGGTDLVALQRYLANLAHGVLGTVKNDACVIFTDGLDTLSGEVFSLPRELSAVAIVSGSERDLEAVRQACGGLAFDLALAPYDAEQLAQTLAAGSTHRSLDVSGSGIADVCDVSSPTGGRRATIGRLVTDESTIFLGDSPYPHLLRATEARNGNVLACAWGARRVSILSPHADQYTDELLRLGKRFGVASPVTSLLVLERLDQWIQYDVEPPAMLAEMHTAWLRHKQNETRFKPYQSEEETHLVTLRRAWRRLLNWWEHDHSTPRQRTYSPIARHCNVFCPHCGNRVNATIIFCESCGLRLQNLDSFHQAPPTSSELLDMRVYTTCENGVSVRAAADTSSTGASTNESTTARPSASVVVKPWSPNASYLQKLDRAYTTDILAARNAYFAQRVRYLTSPSFFADCANWFVQHGDKSFGIDVLSNLAELRIEDSALLRVLAWRLREAGDLERALAILRRIARLRQEDSRSHRDLALVLDELARERHRMGDEDAARSYAEEAAELYRTTALTPWARRRTAIALFAVEEYNVFRAWAAEQVWAVAPELPPLDRDLEGVLACDLRVTLAWDADETDVDIHVTEPSGEEAYYAHRNTTCGGRVSEDITEGFGPELYEIRKAPEGTYTIRAHYFTSYQQTIFGPATCTLSVYTDWGKPSQQQRITSVRLDNAHEMTHVGEVTIGTPANETSSEHKSIIGPDPHGIMVGMSMELVRFIMGEPTEIHRIDPDDAWSAIWVWNYANARSYTVYFRERKVVKVLECMSWGEGMVIAQ